MQARARSRTCRGERYLESWENGNWEGDRPFGGDVRGVHLNHVPLGDADAIGPGGNGERGRRHCQGVIAWGRGERVVCSTALLRGEETSDEESDGGGISLARRAFSSLINWVRTGLCPHLSLKKFESSPKFHHPPRGREENCETGIAKETRD